MSIKKATRRISATVATVVAALLLSMAAVSQLQAVTSRATTLPRLAAAFMLALGIGLFPCLRFLVEP